MCFRVTRCCCFSNTKDGSFAVGIYTAIISLIFVIIYGLVYGQLRNTESIYAGSLNLDESALNSVKAVAIVYIVLQCIWFLISVCLVYGAKTDQRLLLIPWLIWMVVVIAGQFVVFILAFVGMFSYPIYAVTVVIAGLFVAFHIYCYGCVYSQYKLLAEADPSQAAMRKF